MISVIVPVYNAEKYLSCCVDSILGQTYRDLEIILVDDGSTDRSGDICDRYARIDPRVSTVHTANGGVSRARNAGLDIMRGDWVAFVDADDELMPDFCSTMERIATESSACAVWGGFRRDKKKRCAGAQIEVGVVSASQALRDMLYQRNVDCSVCGKLFSAALFRDLRFTAGRRYEDLDLCYRLLSQCQDPIAVADCKLYFYRRNAESFLGVFTAERLDVLTVVDDIECASGDDVCLSAAARSRKLSANFNMFILASASGNMGVADVCWGVVRNYRGEALMDPNVRLKNKIGALLSYLGRNTVLFAARLMYPCCK